MSKEFSKKYSLVGDRTWLKDDFTQQELSKSRSLFIYDELGHPKPKSLEVYALLSGLPFSIDLMNKITDLQNDILSILPHKNVYMVGSYNLGIEYVVFKWPDDILNRSQAKCIESVLDQLKF